MRANKKTSFKIKKEKLQRIKKIIKGEEIGIEKMLHMTDEQRFLLLLDMIWEIVKDE